MTDAPPSFTAMARAHGFLERKGTLMDNFRVILQILRSLEESMDQAEFDRRYLDADYLGISKNRLHAILKMLSDNGYIEGVSCVKGLPGVKIDRNVCITLKGLEYLESNKTLKRAARLMSDVKALNPFS